MENAQNALEIDHRDPSFRRQFGRLRFRALRSKCYKRLGDHSKADTFIQHANKLWEHADPEVQAAMKDLN